MRDHPARVTQSLHPDGVTTTHPLARERARMPAAAPSLSDEQLIEVLALGRDADSFELKLTIPEAEQRSALAELGIDPLDAQIRQVYFFDTPDLALDSHGIVVRGRRVQGKGDDSVVKLRPVVPSELPDELRDSPSFVVEVDAMPGGYVCSASMKGVPRKASVHDVATGASPLRKMLSKEQRSFFATHAPDTVAIDELAPLGPIFVLKLKFMPPSFARKLVAELWLYPDDTRILELSTKCMPSEAFQVAAEARAFLSECGVEATADQHTKTRTALEFFSRRLQSHGRRAT
jgi:hypothetical protein